MSDDGNEGVTENATQNVTTQGLLTSTGTATDMAISGNGFFVVSPQAPTAGAATQQLYTRAGDLTPDDNGDLVNSSGMYLMGWPLDSNGNIPSDRTDMTAVNINTLSGKAEATTTMTLQANLQSSTAINSTYVQGSGAMTSGAVTPDFTRTINVYDSQGGTQPLQVSYLKTGANQWSYEVSYQGDASNLTSTATPTNLIASGRTTSTPDVSRASVVPSRAAPATPTGTTSISIPWSASSGLGAQSISL